MVRRLLSIAVVGLLVFSCYPAEEFDLDEPFRLAYWTARVNSDEDIRIRFDGVVNDDRCPIEYYCFWEGNAEVRLTFWKGDQRETFILNTGVEPSARVVFGYTVELLDLAPPNSVDNPPSRIDYVVTVVVRRAGLGCKDNFDCSYGPIDRLYCSKKVGQCEGVGRCERRPENCTEEYAPVCGCDGRTYSNACVAAAHGVNVDYPGECRDTSCDDGTIPICDMIPPVCSDDEILAYQNNCYRCVNPATCLPWGQANCRDDKDCSADEYCDPCGTSSCPECRDCVPACVPE